MKKLIKISAVLFGCILSVLVDAAMSGFLPSEIEPVPGRIETIQVGYHVDSMAYVPGGVTFSYPSGVFTLAPSVFVQVESPSATVNTVFTTIVSDNSLAGVTVHVYLESIVASSFSVLTDSGVGGYLSAMVEASLLENVTVHLFAIGG